MKEKKKKLNRYTAFFVVMAVIYSIIGSKLISLQVIKTEEYKERANTRAITEVPDPAPRGNIVDRNNIVLGTSRQSYMLVYNETDESKKYFFETMDKVFKLLDDNKEQQQDEFELKVNPFRFEFKTDDVNARRTLEVRFKRDRGLNEQVQKELFPGKKEKLTKEEEKQIDEELLKISPEETFNYLIKQYDITPKSDFKNLLAQYKISPNEAVSEIVKRFNIKDATSLNIKLDEYKNNTKNSKAILDGLIEQYDIEKLQYSLEKQRKYMIIKDTIKMQSFSGYKPVTIGSNIKKETAFIFLERLNDLPGIDVSTQPLRTYPYGELGSAFLGYISKISGNTEKYSEKGYDVSSDYVGTAGLEYVYEDRLKGSKGGRIVKLNKQGRIIEELGRREPYPGETLKLTIDKHVQLAAEKSLDQVMANLRANPISYDGANSSNATRGAAVAIDVNTGGVLALVSRPGYDPNIFSTPGKLTTELYNKFFNPDLEVFAKDYIGGRGLPVTVDEIFPPVDKSSKGSKVLRKDPYDIYPKPFYNYATSSLTAPGSTFKPLTAIAGMEEGVLSANETIYDALVYTKHGYNGRSWNTSTKGNINVVEALAYSNNYFFYEVGDRLYQRGLDTLAEYAWKFGLGVDPNSKEDPSTGIEIPENYGQVFNVQSVKNTSSIYHLWNLYEDLRKIKKNKSTGEYEGIDIEIKKGESKQLTEIKEKMQNTIRQQMRYKNVKDFSKTVTGLFKELISADEKLKNKGFTDGDINIAISKISQSVNSVTEEATRPGNVYNASIGQGTNQFTPLQLANYVSMIANGGKRYKLHLVDSFLDSNNKVIQQVQPEVIDEIKLKPETINTVKQGMLAVTSYEEGTGATVLKDFPIHTAGKTGSATFNEQIQDKIGRTSSAVYVGFAPYDNPKIAICVLIFDGAHGGFAAPVAKAMYEAYFREELAKMNYTPEFKFD
ncbi:penicillin-binding transpeptidase domain-containing protein [Clostridium sp. HMP27]|uniref:penicillin-binding transpeptidase domain-containing protein n=1 Tax=Clostridium sp. HMP27 TaxID=1487921 RepID=UPI00052DC541|nr:penicillin-binding transpeptidase domain-containing protein [Clostridium sp. HMP27]KGK87934.1 penicillin-binding protein [Clostridium sp. HMP27]